MTTTAIRFKVHKYVDEADIKVLGVVYQLLEGYRQSNSSLLTDEQQKEVLKRSALYKAGINYPCKVPSYKIIILEQAISEITESCLYYNNKLPGLGFEFEEEIFQLLYLLA